MMAAMQGLFSMKGQDAMEVLISCLPSPVSSTDVLYNLQNLKECGIKGSQLQRIPWIITQPAGKLSEKLVKIMGPYLFQKHHEGLGFCYLSLELISNYQRRFRNESARFSGHPNRIYYLAEKIQVPVELFTERIGKPHKTLTMNIERLDSFIDMLHRYGITPEDIIADLWVFGYCSTRAEDRLRRAAELGCTDLRPWMCRCSDKIFDRFCARYQSGRDLLGEHESVFDFLSERLNCDRSEVERAFQSNIIMQRVHISKFNRILDLLFSEGIPATEIRMCMRIFQYSELRTAARIQELKNVGFFPFPLSILCRTPAQFRSMVQEFKKRKYMDVLQWNGK